MKSLFNARFVLRHVFVLLLAGSAALVPAAAHAQRDTPNQLYSITGVVPKPIGDFKIQVDKGKGIAVAALWTGAPDRVFAFRFDAGWTVFDAQPDIVCVPDDAGTGCRSEFPINRKNTIVHGHFGPQVMLHSGFVRPYVHIGAGLARFSTAAPADYIDVKDIAFSGIGGAGLLVPVARGNNMIFLDVGARYMYSASPEYLIRAERSNGNLRYFGESASATHAQFYAGLTFGPRAGR
jgi:hypothetical protein